MIKGFSLLEVFVVLSLSVLVLAIVLTSVTESTIYSKRVSRKQQKLEAIFQTVDSIRSDLTKCGTRLQNASVSFGFPMFQSTKDHFKVIYGIDTARLLADCWTGQEAILVERNDYFSSNKTVLIYDADRGHHEFALIKSRKGELVTLADGLKNDYGKNSQAVLVKEVEYKIYSGQKSLKRKVNKGYFQPMIENVTDFNVQYFPEARSVLYRIEVGYREQVRGYVFLINTVSQ